MKGSNACVVLFMKTLLCSLTTYLSTWVILHSLSPTWVILHSPSHTYLPTWVILHSLSPTWVILHSPSHTYLPTWVILHSPSHTYLPTWVILHSPSPRLPCPFGSLCIHKHPANLVSCEDYGGDQPVCWKGVVQGAF